MTTEELKRLRDLYALAEAKHGPQPTAERLRAGFVRDGYAEHLAELYAGTVTHFPALLERVERLESMLMTLRDDEDRFITERGRWSEDALAFFDAALTTEKETTPHE